MTTIDNKNDKPLGNKNNLNKEKIIKWVFIAFLLFVILLLVLFDLSSN